MKSLVAMFKNFPLYFVQWVAGTLTAVMSDPTATLLMVGSVLLGFAVSSVLWAFVTFFIFLAILRTINSIANAIGYGLQGLGFSMKQAAPVPQPAPAQPIVGLEPQPSVSPVQGERINIVAPPASAPGSAFPGD